MTSAPITPKGLAEALKVDPKNLRNFLRKNFPRTPEVKNTSWIITDEAAKAAKDHFAKQEAKA